MKCTELAQKVASEWRFGPAKSEPWRGGLRTSLSGFKKYEEKLPMHQRFQDPTCVAPSLLVQGLPLCADADVEDDGAEADRSAALQEIDQAARAEDIASFVRATRQIDWSVVPADELADTIQLALRIEAHAIAHELAGIGGRLHPSHPLLARMARILAPPRFLGTRAADPSLAASMAANREWLQRESPSYRGSWVALRDGRVLAHGDTAEALRPVVGSQRGVLLTRVW